jgi:hypothetical protein
MLCYSGSSSPRRLINLKIEALRFFEISVTFYQSAWCSIPEKWGIFITADRTSNSQYRQYTYNVTLRSDRAAIVIVEMH